MKDMSEISSVSTHHDRDIAVVDTMIVDWRSEQVRIGFRPVGLCFNTEANLFERRAYHSTRLMGFDSGMTVLATSP